MHLNQNFIYPSLQVEFPEGRKTLCLLPAKFHKKLWINRGTFLIVEDFEDAESRVTGQIINVLYDDHVKQLKKYDGVWWVYMGLVIGFSVLWCAPPFGFRKHTNSNLIFLCSFLLCRPEAFAESNYSFNPVAATEPETSKCAGLLDALGNLNLEGDKAPHVTSTETKSKESEGIHEGEEGRVYSASEDDSSDSDLPPLQAIQNRKVIEYEESESDSD